MEAADFLCHIDQNHDSDEETEISIQSNLSSGTIDIPYDPMNVITLQPYLSALSSSLVQDALRYRFSIMTPRMPHTAEVANPFIDSWFPLSLTMEFVFSSIIMSSLSHKRTKSLISKDSIEPFTMQEQQLLEESYIDTVKALNGILRSPTAAATDATMLAVLMMIEMPVVTSTKDWQKESPFQAPLQGLQWLNIHGAREPNLSHQMGLCKLVELRGGLNNIRIPGLAPAISYRVTVNAALTLSPPCLPYFPLSGNHNFDLTDIIYASPDYPELRFSGIYSLGLSEELIEVFQAMAVYTSVLERYISGESPQMDNQTLCDWRNLLQHRVLSLPSKEAKSTANIKYEVFRICALIYSIGVTFPLPGPGAPFIPLAKMLLSNLQCVDLELVSPSIPESQDVFIWILTMGGIAATGSAERSWFAEEIYERTLSADMFEWSQYKTRLKNFLWLDIACDMAGKLLWNDLQALKQVQDINSFPAIPENQSPCGQCQARKIRCDKLFPCQNCTRGGYKCSQSIDNGDLKPPRVHIYSSRKRPCELCRQRKVKCDKQQPCQNCTKGNFACTYF